MPRLLSCLVAILVALAAVAPVVADGGTARVSQIDANAFPTVDVYVSALDRNQHPISGLRQQDFHVFENGQEVPFAFKSSGFDVAVVLVIDQSGSMSYAGKMDAAKQAALTFVHGMKPNDRIALIAFSDAVTVAQPLSTDKAATAAQVRKLAPSDGTALFDATMHALDMLRPVRGRKAAIVLTDGMDNRSRARVDDVVKRARQDTASIYTIGLGARSSTSSTAGVDEEVLKRLAGATTGQYYYAPDPSTLSRLYQRLAQRLGAEYRLWYRTPRDVRDGTRRTVDVRVRLTGTGDTTASGSYLVGGVLGAGGINWLVFAGLLAVLAALLYPGGVPAILDARSARVRAEALSVVSPPPVEPVAVPPVAARSMDQRQRDIVMTRWPFRVGNGAGDDLRIDDPLLGESMVQFEVLQQRLVVRVLKTSADVLVSYSGQPEHWRPVNQTNALKDGSRISINGHVFEVHMTPWRLRGALEKDIS